MVVWKQLEEKIAPGVWWVWNLEKHRWQLLEGGSHGMDILDSNRDSVCTLCRSHLPLILIIENIRNRTLNNDNIVQTEHTVDGSEIHLTSWAW